MRQFKADKREMFPEPVWATVETVQNQIVRVKFNSTTWFAKPLTPDRKLNLFPGQLVQIVGIEGNTLLMIVEVRSL